ncbi:oxidoreductase [Sporosarcina sp. NCCP-2716]|uniref:gluconate 2-dehydrogenase subunit 3 family protein n=1 Tax=Sporosarcina sp. NCCP-2716 TaxID=2943679 RepID=UPI00204233BA|nr:gluconate 2-dehydrogenase subunit 3 family protein [Sporosarcina sp. NCCP-2716]GKV70321.1 oxidoreductase [Sporosarcina sp. NCCP-2716]
MSDKRPPRTSKEEAQHQQDMSRRKFLKNSGLLAGGLVGGGLFGGLITNSFDKKEEKAVVSKKDNNRMDEQARQFFTRHHDFNVLSAATEQIFPEDEHGPGAIKLGVPYYIDQQLAGRWGINGRDYRHSPYAVDLDKSDQQAGPAGEQSILDRGHLFLLGLRKMDDESQKRFSKPFDEADEDQQIEVMKDFEDNKIPMKGVKASEFFNLLINSTLEGAYSDPLYGGNYNMEGWKMKEFPGAQASYAGYIEQDEFKKLEPVSLRDYQGH